MVGRGGRSRACFICRQRRLKCDENKPQCLRCKNSGLECIGYPDHEPFVHVDPASLTQRSKRARQRQASQPSKPGQSLSVLGEDVYFAYLGQEIQTGSPLLDSRWPGLLALQMPDCLSRRCIKSFAASLFGRRNANEHARREGMRFYIESLKELNGHLSNPQNEIPGQTVLAIGILTACEWLTTMSRTGWIQHMLGMNTYLGLRGFEIFQGPYVLQQFETDRFSMVVAAIATGRPICLASEEWITQPWVAAGKRKRQRQYLLDHACQLPRLFHDFIAQKRLTKIEDKVFSSLAFEKSMSELLNALCRWRLNWQTQDEPHIEQVSLSAAERNENNVETKLAFDSVNDTAFTFLLYNTILVVLLELWKTFRKAQIGLPLHTEMMVEHDGQPLSNQYTIGTGSSDMSSGDDRALPTIASLTSLSQNAALDICRTLPSFRMASGTWTHAVQVVVSARMALVVCRQEEHARQRVIWLEGIIEQLSDPRQGLEMGKYATKGFGYY